MSVSETSTPHPVASEDPTIELLNATVRGPWLLEVGTIGGSRFVQIGAHDRVVIGSGRTADVKVEDRAVSARHALFVATPSGLVVEDLESTNGVFVGGARVMRAVLTGRACHLVVGRTSICIRPFSDADDLALAEVPPLPGLVGASLAMRRLARDVRKAAPLRCTVLIQGESGSGKDLVARSLHALSGRVGDYVPLNVGAIPESLADAELFGHRRGAFTGAISARPGAFEEAHQGTLFLDEIAELPPAIQVKLLRVVEDRVVRPVGGEPIEVDVRIISATWSPLAECVGSGRFREDLYHRIATLTIDVPPLRHRRSDIPALSQALLARMKDDIGERQLSSAALAVLQAYAWPGNVRELGSMLYRACIFAEGTHVEAHHIELAMPRVAKVRPPSLSASDAQKILEQFNGNVSAAARAARVPRSTFRSWLDKTKFGVQEISDGQNAPDSANPLNVGDTTGTTANVLRDAGAFFADSVGDDDK